MKMNTDKSVRTAGRANENAFPVPGLQTDPDFNGLSIREYFAGLIASGLAANSRRSGSAEEFAQETVSYADALVAALAPAQEAQT